MEECASRTSGFRFSKTDALAIAIGIAASAVLFPFIGELAVLPVFVLGHYFLFCNVFRIPRRPEVIWAATFVALFGIGYGSLRLPLWMVLVAQLPITAVLILNEMRKPGYPGVGCRKVNLEKH